MSRPSGRLVAVPDRRDNLQRRGRVGECVGGDLDRAVRQRGDGAGRCWGLNLVEVLSDDGWNHRGVHRP